MTPEEFGRLMLTQRRSGRARKGGAETYLFDVGPYLGKFQYIWGGTTISTIYLDDKIIKAKVNHEKDIFEWNRPPSATDIMKIMLYL